MNPHRRLVTLLAALVGFATLAPSLRANDQVLWVPIQNALFTVDGKAVKAWNLYHAKEKKDHRLLLQIGTRCLMIDTQLRLIAEYDPAVFSKQGNDQQMPRDTKGIRALPSEGWVVRDTGTSYLIQAKLKEEAHLIEIELPKMPDFRNVLW